MILINLLPPEIRPKEKHPVDLSAIPLTKFFVMGLAVILSLQILSGLTLKSQSRSLKHLEHQWAQVLPIKIEMDRLKELLKNTRKRVDLLQEMMKRDILWSAKLNQLSDSLTQGIWLRRLSMDERDLKIDGSVAAQGQETAFTGRFIAALKNNAAFMESFDEIELLTLDQKQSQDNNVFNFTLICRFKDNIKR